MASASSRARSSSSLEEANAAAAGEARDQVVELVAGELPAGRFGDRVVVALEVR